MLLGLAGLAWVQTGTSRPMPRILPYLFAWIFTLGTGCLLCYAAAPQNRRVRWLCAPWLRWCGIISYEWYLFHQPMIQWTRGFFGPASGNVFKYLIILGVPLVVSLVFSALVYRNFRCPSCNMAARKNPRENNRPDYFQFNRIHDLRKQKAGVITPGYF